MSIIFLLISRIYNHFIGGKSACCNSKIIESKAVYDSDIEYAGNVCSKCKNHC